MAFTQVLKLLPINVRPFYCVQRAETKGGALFLQHWSSLQLGLQTRLAEVMQSNWHVRSEYPLVLGIQFPMQTSTALVLRRRTGCTRLPQSAPRTIQTTVSESLEMAKGCRYILKDFYWTDGASVAGFSYPMRDSVSSPQPEMSGVALLCRVTAHWRHTLSKRLKSARTRR